MQKETFAYKLGSLLEFLLKPVSFIQISGFVVIYLLAGLAITGGVKETLEDHYPALALSAGLAVGALLLGRALKGMIERLIKS